MEDNYLAHHGVKGQKWGVRRYQNEDGTLTPEGKRRYGKTFFERAFGNKKPKKESVDDKIKKMSDQELQAAINRLSNEKRYKELISSTKKKGFLAVLGEGLSKGTSKATSDLTSQLGKSITNNIVKTLFPNDNEPSKEDKEKNKDVEEIKKYIDNLIKERETDDDDDDDDGNKKKKGKKVIDGYIDDYDERWLY